MTDGDRTSSRYYERFHLNQFYNAVEDEQLFADEYTNLLQSYNQFIVTGNAMFSRMEQALRANLDRSIVRQYFYYHRYSDIRRIRSPDEAIYHFTHAPAAAPAPAPAAAPAAATAPAPAAAPAPADASRRSRLGDAFGRMLSNYLTAQNNRNARENAYMVRDNDTGTTPPNTNLFSMLYTYAQPIVTGAAAAVTGAANAERGPPSAATINRATLNTTYASIVSPVNTTCPISRDEFEDNSEITMIRGCNHIFNRASLREWFVNHSTCPMCRNNIHNYRNFANMEINNITNDSVTFSYDVPPIYNRYDDEAIYRDILNAVAGTAAATTTTTTTTTTQAPPAATTRSSHRRYDDHDPDNDHDSHDYMEVD
jgi:hypothetical protein